MAASAAFAGFRFPPEVIVVAVRWYLRYGLSYRDVEELLVERGVEVDHVTVYRWMQRFTLLLVDAARFCRHSPGDRWFVDETYLRVGGVWRYVYRAVDQDGQVIDHQSAGRSKGASTGKGNPWLAATIGEAVAALSRTDTFLGERYRRLVRRRGKKRAIVAVGNSMFTIIWHLLSDPDARYRDLGSDFYESKISKQRRQRDLIRQLEHLTGHKIVLEPRPDQPAAA